MPSDPKHSLALQQKADQIHAILERLYPVVDVPLEAENPYTFLIAVLLSAQCTDKKVNAVSPKLFARADNPRDMLKLSVEEIEGIIRPCGLAPRKSKNIWALSELLLRDHDGQVPRDFEGLEALPGVGHKTASVVMSQAFGTDAFPVDTHIHRLAARWGLSDGSNVVKTEADLKALFAPKDWHKVHLQIIFFGREHCPALYHDLRGCPICAWASTQERAAQEDAANEALKAARRKKRREPAEDQDDPSP